MNLSIQLQILIIGCITVGLIVLYVNMARELNVLKDRSITMQETEDAN